MSKWVLTTIPISTLTQCPHTTTTFDSLFQLPHFHTKYTSNTLIPSYVVDHTCKSHTRLANLYWRINYVQTKMISSYVSYNLLMGKTVIYIYVCGQCRTQCMLPNSSRR